ncbi:MAG: recombinase family protein [Cutibacterium granulosum]|nr:recombinase family protein [Cutibacterium granulosum]
MTIFGYARVSTTTQDDTAQVEALHRADVTDDHLFIDHASGTRTDRPELNRMWDQMQSGDVLTVWKLDRLGRSTSHLVSLVNDLGQRGIQFRSLTEGMDTTTAQGALLFTILAGFAQFERDLIAERTRAGLEAARARGKRPGRPTVVRPEQASLVHHLRASGMTQAKIAASVGLSPATVGRVLRGEIARLITADTDETLFPH